MLRITEQELQNLELSYPGILKYVYHIEASAIPSCAFCESLDTAMVQGGLIGRTIAIAASTTKFKLVPNPGEFPPYFCNRCGMFYKE